VKVAEVVAIAFWDVDSSESDMTGVADGMLDVIV
jgi:hypothetical protein